MTSSEIAVTRIHSSVAAVCPILGVSIGTMGVSASVRIDFDPAATPAQRAAAQNVVDTFDWSQAAQDAYDNQQARTAAVASLSDVQAEHKLLRALALVLLDEINTLRATVVPALPARTMAQLRTAIANKINSGGADS